MLSITHVQLTATGLGTQNHLVRKWTLNHLAKTSFLFTYTFRVNPHYIVAWISRNSLLKAGTKSEAWLNGWVFLYKISGSGFECSCSHLNFQFCTCFEQGVPWHSGNCRVWIHSETPPWHEKNIQTHAQYLI